MDAHTIAPAVADEPRASAPAMRPVSMPFVDRFASAVVTAAPPIMLLIGMWFGWTGNLLNWQDLLILALFYIGDRHRHHRRLSPVADAPQLQDAAASCAPGSRRSARPRPRAR